MTDTRTAVIRLVARLIDYGKDGQDMEFNDLSLGDIADRFIALITPEAAYDALTEAADEHIELWMLPSSVDYECAKKVQAWLHDRAAEALK